MRYIVSILIYFIALSPGHSQDNPIVFLNNSYTINIDTIHNENFYHFGILNLTFKFVNTGSHVTFIDTTLHRRTQNQYITKPGDTSCVKLEFHDFYGDFNLKESKDTSAFIFIPFHYENKVYYSKLLCLVKHGQGKLITIDSSKIDVTDKVTEFVKGNNIDPLKCSYPNFKYTCIINVINKSGHKINCTKMLKFWEDVSRNTIYNVIELESDGKYQLPISLHMGKRYNFKRNDCFIVFDHNTIEPYNISVFSNYK